RRVFAEHGRHIVWVQWPSTEFQKDVDRFWPLHVFGARVHFRILRPRWINAVLPKPRSGAIDIPTTTLKGRGEPGETRIAKYPEPIGARDAGIAQCETDTVQARRSIISGVITAKDLFAEIWRQPTHAY